MASSNILLICSLVIFSGLALVHIATAQEPPKEMSCKSAIALLMKRQLQGISKCSKSMKFKNGKDKAAKMTCILKCVLIAEKVIPEDGQPTREYLDAFIEREIPKNLLSKALPVINKCFDLAIGKVDTTEEYCKTYDPAIKCLMNVLPTFCQGEE